MAIASRDDYIAAKKQRAIINKTASITAVAFQQTQNIQAAGNPGAGTLAGTSTAAGVVRQMPLLVIQSSTLSTVGQPAI